MDEKGAIYLSYSDEDVIATSDVEELEETRVTNVDYLAKLFKRYQDPEDISAKRDGDDIEHATHDSTDGITVGVTGLTLASDLSRYWASNKRQVHNRIKLI